MRWVGEEETLVRPFLRKRKRKTIYPEKKAPYRKCEIVTNAGKQLVPLTSLSHVTWQTRSYLLKNLRVLDDYLLGTPFTKPFIALPGSNSSFLFLARFYSMTRSSNTSQSKSDTYFFYFVAKRRNGRQSPLENDNFMRSYK